MRALRKLFRVIVVLRLLLGVVVISRVYDHHCLNTNRIHLLNAVSISRSHEVQTASMWPGLTRVTREM